MNVINVGKIFREHTKFRVSPEAVHEYATRIVDYMERNIPQIEEIAQREGKNTIQENDVVKFFGFKDNTPTGDPEGD